MGRNAMPLSYGFLGIYLSMYHLSVSTIMKCEMNR
jgi:hypothetical protein